MDVAVIALLGGESTGKSALASALRDTAHAQHVPARLVTETLRGWVDQHQRTPLVHEQALIADAQQAAIETAVRQLESHPSPNMNTVGLVIADTTPFQTAAYSAHYFGDGSRWGTAVEAERAGPMRVRLLMGLDLTWVADDGQRDGVNAQSAVDALLRAQLQLYSLPFQVIYGRGPSRAQAAWAAIANALGREDWLTPQPESQRRSDWVCQDCSDPDCELRLFTGLLARRPQGAG